MPGIASWGRPAAHAFDMSSDIVYIFDRLEDRYLSVNERGEFGPSEKTRPELIRHYSTKGSLADDEVSMTTYRVRHLRGDYKMLRCKQKVFSRTKDGSTKCIVGLPTHVTDEARRPSEIKGLRAEVCRIREFERERITAWLTTPSFRTCWRS